jgi:hypothetical protein
MSYLGNGLRENDRNYMSLNIFLNYSEWIKRVDMGIPETDSGSMDSGKVLRDGHEKKQQKYVRKICIIRGNS